MSIAKRAKSILRWQKNRQVNSREALIRIIDHADFLLTKAAQSGLKIDDNVARPIQEMIAARDISHWDPEKVASFRSAYVSLGAIAQNVTWRSANLLRTSLKDDIDDAEDLIKYAAQVGISLPLSDVATVFKMRQSQEDHKIDIDLQSSFYESFSKISKSLGEVTAETIQNCTSPETKALLRWNRWLAIGLTFVAAAISLGNSALDTSSNKIKVDIERANIIAANLRSSIGEAPSDLKQDPCSKVGMPPADGRTNFVSPENLKTLQDFVSLIREIHSRTIKLNGVLLSQECDPILGCSDKDTPLSTEMVAQARKELELNPEVKNYIAESFCKIRVYQDVRNFAENTRDNYVAVFAAITSNLLPILYSVLGAFAFRLRAFSDTINKRTFHPSFADSARMITAVIAGAICGMLNPAQSLSLSPLATAFLVGYGVEIFFKFLDSLLNAFGSNSKSA